MFGDGEVDRFPAERWPLVVKAFKVVRSVLFALGGGGAVVFTVFLVVEGLGDGGGGFIEFGGVGDVDWAVFGDREAFTQLGVSLFDDPG